MVTPVLLDTDIGTDIDDTWALAMLLNSPEIDLRAVVTTHGDVVHRAGLTARLLEIAGRTDVPVGVGVGSGQLDRYPQAGWLGDFHFDDYRGSSRHDGVDLFIETIHASSEPMTVLSIGPTSTVAAALERDPSIAARARFVGMHGAIRRGYRESPEPVPEYNVFIDVDAFRKVLAAPWEIVITPLDTCGSIILRDARYQRFRNEASGELAEAVRANYAAWAATFDAGDLTRRRSTTLYDTVAVYLAFSTDLLLMEDVGVDVTDDGLMRETAGGRVVSAAMDWRDFDGFLDLLLDRLCVDGRLGVDA